METQTDRPDRRSQRSERLRQFLGWTDRDGVGITNNEAIKKLHEGKEARQVGAHLDETASDTGIRRLDKTGRR